MKDNPPDNPDKTPADPTRRRILGGLALAGGLLATTREAQARTADEDALFGEAEHKVVYQLNKFDRGYIKDILHSVAVVLQTYPDNVHIVITCFGPGIWVLVKPSSNRHKLDTYITEMISSQSVYGVEFHACEQTMKTLSLGSTDLIDEASVVPSGAVDLMKLQKKQYAYIAW